MEPKIIRGKEQEELDLGFIRIKNLLNYEEIKNLSIKEITIEGVNEKVINHGGDGVYYILEGSGTFNINGREVLVKKGDALYIPKGMAYFDSGSMKMLAVHCPRYDIKLVEYPDEKY